MGPVTPGPAVVARGLSLHYPSGRAGLVSLDLTVDPGEVVVALGPNGSGKSTLLRVLATDLRPDSGELRLLGRPIERRRPPRDVRRRIGYAPDTPVHIPWLTGEEHARFLADVRGGSKERGDALPEILSSFELDEVRSLPIASYSFGMRRKLLLAEALAPAPNLLLMDEPTVGLDPPGMAALKEAVAGSAGQGCAVVIASNETRQVPRWADRVLFLHGGRVIEDAPPTVLMRRLRGRTRIEIELAGNRSSPEALDAGKIPGVESWRFLNGSVRVESSSGGSPLPSLIDAVHAAGAAVRDIRVREPDLGDLFLELTGSPLSSGHGERTPGSGDPRR